MFKATVIQATNPAGTPVTLTLTLLHEHYTRESRAIMLRMARAASITPVAVSFV